MLVRVLSLVAVFVAAGVPPSAARTADPPVLDATVGPNDAFVITLTDATGAKVGHLDPGTYTIRVHDLSDDHNFHLTGPGVNQATTVEGVQELTWTVTLTDGIYTYVCDPHAGIMRGRFAVGTAQLPPPTATLNATVGPGRTIAVRRPSGAKATILNGVEAVTLRVDDRSRADNFRLTGPGVNRATGVKFRGRVTWKLSVRPGVYRYRSDAHKALRGSFSVTAGAFRAG